MKVMQFKSTGPVGAWQFDPRDNTDQPVFVHVTTALAGPRAIARPHATKDDPNPVFLPLDPLDWLVLLPTGVYIVLSDHAATHLLKEEL